MEVPDLGVVGSTPRSQEPGGGVRRPQEPVLPAVVRPVPNTAWACVPYRRPRRQRRQTGGRRAASTVRAYREMQPQSRRCIDRRRRADPRTAGNLSRGVRQNEPQSLRPNLNELPAPDPRVTAPSPAPKGGQCDACQLLVPPDRDPAPREGQSCDARFTGVVHELAANKDCYPTRERMCCSSSSEAAGLFPNLGSGALSPGSGRWHSRRALPSGRRC